MRVLVSLLCILSCVTQAAPMDLVWASEKLLIAGQQSRLPYLPPWPEKQANLVAYGMTGVVPAGVNCQLELRLQEQLLLSLPCSKRYVLERPLRITPGMRVELFLHNTNLFSPGETVTLRNRLSLEVLD
jgi:hypothetical protein